jgi:DNA invertase Pin-like site-specific DNA recombinase
MRAVLYARFSSDRQNERSADDQLAALRRVLAQRGWTEAGAYADRGISGSAIANRPQLRALLRQAQAGGCEVVMAEDLDRISRDQEDTAHIYKRLAFAGVALETLAQGPIGVMHVGLGSTLNQLFLEQLRHKTRRGLEARVRAGFSAGGRCYGYRITGKGVLEPDPAQAAIVREVLERYLRGEGPRAIAKDLNRRGVPGPRGGGWTQSTIHGDRRAGDGLLHQELHVGVRVFNRRRFRKDPDTGRRSSILNPRESWIRQPAPELAIVDGDLWARVQAKAAALAELPRGRARRPTRLLSGLIRCTVCGGGMTLQGRGTYGCSAHRERGTCGNVRLVPAAALESRVIEGVKARMLTPAAIAEAVGRWRAEDDAERTATLRDRGQLEAELAELQRRIGRASDAYEAGHYELDELAARTGPLKARQAELQDRLAQAEAPRAVPLHPRAADHYRELLEDLAAALEGEDALDAREAFRALIERVDFTPLEGRGAYALQVHGKVSTPTRGADPVAEKLGAGTRSGQDRTLRIRFAA